MNIIRSLLDTDLYKFTMMQVVFHHFPETTCSYGFKCRNGEDLKPYADEIREQIDSLRALRLSKEEEQYLRSLPFIQDDFVDYLVGFYLDPNLVTVDSSGDELTIEIEGKWLDTILFEVPVLAIVNEIYFKCQTEDHVEKAKREGRGLLEQKVSVAENSEIKLSYADFGTRRRFSRSWHEEIIGRLKGTRGFLGTSNIDLARRYDLKPIGTMAHEFLQAAQVLGPSVEDTNSFALEMWTKEYGQQLNVALTDIFGIDAFLSDFDAQKAHYDYSGLRHDSGDPFEFGEKVIAHYEQLGIDPQTKTLIFSDGLDFPKMSEIAEHFEDRIGVGFGIGTNLTNDVGYKPLNIVIKMITCNGQPTVKISDSPGKVMCRDQDYIKKVRKVIEKKKIVKQN